MLWIQLLTAIGILPTEIHKQMQFDYGDDCVDLSFGLAVQKKKVKVVNPQKADFVKQTTCN